MGMDVYGRAPTSDEGEYFRSSIWTWPTVIEAIASVDVLPGELVSAMCYNDGAGPDAAQAIALADALEAKYGDMPADGVFITEGELTHTGTAEVGRQLMEVLPMAPGSEEAEFSADVEFVLKFAKFARHSGGFHVW